jgi:hypothetical protein
MGARKSPNVHAERAEFPFELHEVARYAADALVAKHLGAHDNDHQDSPARVI